MNEIEKTIEKMKEDMKTWDGHIYQIPNEKKEITEVFMLWVKTRWAFGCIEDFLTELSKVRKYILEAKYNDAAI